MAEQDRNTVEFLKDQATGARTAHGWLDPCAYGAWAAGLQRKMTSKYVGGSYWLCVMGVGNPVYGAARDAHVASGRPVACWDMGYVGKTKYLLNCYCRVSLNTDHPTDEDIETTEPNPYRWCLLGERLRNDADPRGPVLVIGMGPKAHAYLSDGGWELSALRAAKARFPNRDVIYRPKPLRHNLVPVEWPNVLEEMSITKALRGVSLVICKHSNVAVDACIAGVPVECESGAAHWLYSRHPVPTEPQRLDFLYRLAWWQWRLREKDMEKAWYFLMPRRKAVPSAPA
jgi:hypothetical protein